MFRTRKEDSLFDNTTDPNDVQVKVLEPVAAAPAAAATYTPAPSMSPAPAALRPSAPAQPEAPRAAVPSANSFRPGAAPLAGNDLQRNRLPEAKPQPAPAAAAAPVAPAPAPTANISTPPAAPAMQRTNQRVLTVGNDILLKGEIATCDRLVIEGQVDATLKEVHTVEIAPSGSFKGSAHIQDAEISGLFEGDLTVTGRLVIYATGKVRGKISYGEVEIERGGELTGEIKIASAQPAGRSKSEKFAA